MIKNSFRAIFLGLAVTVVPTVLWAVLIGINMKRTPSVPWAVAAMGIVLWIYWRCVSAGQARRLSSIGSPTPAVWRASLLAGGVAIASVWALFASLRGLLHIQAPSDDMSRIPITTVIAAVLMGAAVAAITEEVGFRGFMQQGLERVHGPKIAIGVTALLFTLAHLTHGAAILPFLPFFFAAGLIYGLLTYFTGSILPAMTLHFIGDVMLFATRYAAARQGVTATPGAISIGPAIDFVILAVLSVIAFRFLARQKNGTLPPRSLFATLMSISI